jgi:hypothetical protein
MWVATALALAACGGDAPEVGATSADDRASDAGSEGAAGVDVTIGGDDGEVLVVTSERPDWLPVWLLLPEGLDISAAMNTPGSGEAAVTGSVPDSDADELYNDASFMVQSGGYVITEEVEAGGRGFTAEHTSDGSIARFSVVQVTDDLHQWSWEFEGLGGSESRSGNAQPAGGAGDIGLDPLERRGNLTITVMSPRVFTRIDGACDGSNSQVQFLSDDGLSKFIVFTGDAVGGAGEITADVEGEQLTWVAAAESETSASQTDRTSAYYEGDFITGSDVVFAVVQITCNE